MSDHIGLTYLLDQPNLNAKQARWLATICEFEIEIRYIKGKENRVVDALSRWVQVNHIAAMSSYGIDLQDKILRAGKHDIRYMEIVDMLEQGDNIGIGIRTCSGIGGSTCTCTGTGAGARDLDY